MLAAFVIFCTPAFSSSEKIRLDRDGTSYLLSTSGGFDPRLGDSINISIKTGNPERLDYPYGTSVISWFSRDNPDGAAGRERFKIYIDGFTHRYNILPGSNKDWNEAGEISYMRLELPSFEGVGFEVLGASLKKRIFFPLDLYFAGLSKDQDIPGYASTDKFLMPAYIMMVILIILAGIYFLLFRGSRSRRDHLDKIIKRSIFISIVIILLFFSAAYIYREVLSVKSYWTAYGDDLISGNIEDTYHGIYDFEKFIIWADSTIPEGKDIIVFIKGEPVYIMSEMAYNMYPRDIRFIDISGKTPGEIKNDIENITGPFDDAHDYLVMLSEDDAGLASGYELTARYRSTGGYIFKLE